MPYQGVEVPPGLLEAIAAFPLRREVTHCGVSFSVSPFDFHAECPCCRVRIKVRSFAAVPELEDVFDAVFEWMNQEGAAELARRRQAEIAEDRDWTRRWTSAPDLHGRKAMPPIVRVPESSALVQQFETLAEQWKAAIALLSSTTAMMSHPTYQVIIALGPPVVPLLLRDLERAPVHWFEALQAITGEDPVPCEHWGNMPAMAADWLAWRRRKGLIW
jgi:hypothetical protein